MQARVVHIKRDYYDVRIDRATCWGNPFLIGRDGTRSQVIDQYRRWIVCQAELMSRLGELHDKVLGCWCAPHACHGDVLAELADMPVDNLIRLSLTEVIEPSYVDTWMGMPNDRFNGRAPAEVAKTEPNLLWEMIERLMSGEPI